MTSRISQFGKSLAPAALALSLAAAAWGAEPKAVVSGPSTVAAGQTIWLDASGSAADAPLVWQSDKPALVKIRRVAVEDGPPGSMAIVNNAPAGRYEFTVIAIGTPEGGKTPAAAASVVVTVQGEKPPIPPGPAPPPGPPPVPPAPDPSPDDAATLGLASWVQQKVAAQPWTPEQKAYGATLLANVFAFASVLPAADPKALVDATGGLMKTTLPADHYAAWHPAVVEPLKARLAELNASGKLASTVPAHRAAWREIANGFKGASK